MSTRRDPDVMTLAEAARICGRDVETLKRWIAKGAITKYRDPGGRVFVDVRQCLPRPVDTSPRK